MEKGKVLSLISGIITLTASFLFTLFTYSIADNTHYVSGLLGINRVIHMMYAPYTIFHILSIIVLLIFLFSGVLQILGFKYRSFTFLGSVLPLFFSIIILLGVFGLISVQYLGALYILGSDQPIIDGILPLHISIINPNDSLGVYLLLGSSVIAIISSLIKREG